MNKSLVIKASNAVFVGFSLLGLTSVSLLSLFDPQATMDLVKVTLDNTDALSSIRGIYGGVGITIIIGIGYLYFTKVGLSIRFLTLFWGTYALARLITMIVDGPLGEFGCQWIVVESVLCLVGMGLVVLNKTYENGKP